MTQSWKDQTLQRVALTGIVVTALFFSMFVIELLAKEPVDQPKPTVELIPSGCDSRSVEDTITSTCCHSASKAEIEYDKLTARLKDKKQKVASVGHPDLVWDDKLWELVYQRSQEVDSVWLSNDQVSEKLLTRIAKTLTLKKLVLYRVTRGRGVFSVLKQFPTLEYLALNESEIDDEDLSGLSEMKSLSRLLLTNCQCLKGDGLAYLWSCRQLHYLNLDDTLLQSSSVQSLRMVTSLRILSLSRTKLTDSDLTFVADLPYLGYLYLHRCKNVTGRFLTHLQESRFLGFVDMGNTNANDDCLEHIVRFNHKVHVDLNNTRLTRDAVNWFLLSAPPSSINWPSFTPDLDLDEEYLDMPFDNN